MDGKSISIQSDEVTKNIMSEIQDHMIYSFSKASKNMTSDVLEKIKPLEKKISDLKENLEEDNEELEEKIDDLNNNLLKITKTIEITMHASLEKIISEQNKMLYDNINAIIGSNDEIKKIIEDKSNNLKNKIDNINIGSVKDKMTLVGQAIIREVGNNKDEILEKIDNIEMEEIEEKVDGLEKTIERCFLDNKMILLEKINKVSDKIDQKDILIQAINRLEGELSTKISEIQEEVEWGNKSFFSRIFGRKR